MLIPARCSDRYGVYAKMNRNLMVALAVGAVALLAALWFLLGSNKKPEQVQVPTAAVGDKCKLNDECSPDGSLTCCDGVCVKECLESIEGIEPSRETPRVKVLRPSVRSTLERLPARTRSQSLRGDLAPGQCRQESDCSGSLQDCDTNTGLCVEPSICLTDEDCNGKRVCQFGQCVDEVEGCRFEDCMPKGYCHSKYQECENHNCQTDADCAGPRRCDSNQNLCVQCLEDKDCATGEKCTPGWFCMDSKDGCGGDGDCDEGLCDENTHKCSTAPCTDDEHEDNDKWSSAKELKPGAYDMMSCPADNDNYRIDLSEGEGLVAHASFPNLSGMIELRLLDTNGVEIWRAGDNKLVGEAALVWERAEKDAIYYLSVKHRYGLAVPYHLEVDIWPDGICRNDKYEPNNTADLAATTNDRFRWEVKLCGAEDDWYLKSVKAGQTLKMMIDVSQGEVPRVDVFRGDEEKPFWSDETLTPQKVFIQKVTRDTDFYIRVSPLFPQGDSLYGLRTEITQGTEEKQ